MKKILLVLFVFLITTAQARQQLLNISSSSIKIDPEIIKSFDLQPEIYVSVLLRDESNLVYEGDFKQRENTFDLKRKYFEKSHEEVLSTLTKKDFRLEYRYTTINAFTGFLTRSGLEKLKMNTKVETIETNKMINQNLQQSVPLINADKVWSVIFNNSNITGKGNTTVCVIDGGINYTHSDLGACSFNDFSNNNCTKVISGYDYCATNNCATNDTDPMDNLGHGTHVAGIIGANGKIKGVAPDVNLIAMKVCEDNSSRCGTIAIGKGVDWCRSNASIYNISTITISIGDNLIYGSNCDPSYSGYSTTTTAINNAFDSGIYVDISSGNDGYMNGTSWPSCTRGSSSVGAIYDNSLGRQPPNGNWTPANCFDTNSRIDIITCFTNRANNLDLLAPGSIINSTTFNGIYAEDSGTSMAAPHVAGLAALLKQANGSLLPTQIETTMKRTGKPIYDNATKLTFPRIDAYRSVMSVLYDIFVNDLKKLYSDDQGRWVFEFSMFNDLSVNATVNWTMHFGDGNNVTSSSFVINPYNESLVYVDYIYPKEGRFNVTVNIMSENGTVANQTMQINVSKPNLRATNLSVLDTNSTRRIFEIWINNNASAQYSNITWQLNATGSGNDPVSSLQTMTLASNETAFVYVDYVYSQLGSHDVNATVDYDGRHSESNETDNTKTIVDLG